MGSTSKKGTLQTGKKGEDLAVNFLEKSGYVVVDRNYRALHAEIDIICRDPGADDELVFVEVKTRTTQEFGDPLDAVSARKISFLKRAAEAYLYEKNLDDAPCRIDVVGIWMRTEKQPVIEHFKDAVEY